MPNKKPLATIDEVFITLKSLVRQINERFNKQDKFNKSFVQELKSLNKRFVHQEQVFFDWKSDLFTKIDTDCLKPIRDLQEEDSAQQFRLENHEKRIAKLEKWPSPKIQPSILQ